MEEVAAFSANPAFEVRVQEDPSDNKDKMNTQTETKTKTESHLEKANRLIPGGANTSSKSPSRYVQGPSPLFVKSAYGCHFLDMEGRRYLDFGMGLGACILGYNRPEINHAAWRAISMEGSLFTLPSYREAQTAEALLSYIPWAEQVRFGKTGTDVTTAAVRVARAYTGRTGVYSHGYHGWGDWSVSLTSPAIGIPIADIDNEGLSLETVRLKYGEDPLSCAAVIVEIAPGGILEDDWLHELREQCDRTGTVLIFDEVLSGFRYRMGSATDVIPDLACFGKSIGNGFSISALVGKRDLMQLLEPGGVFFSGTFFGETTGLAACEATLKVMEECQVPAYVSSIGFSFKRKANRVMDGIWTGDGARTTTNSLSPLERDFIQQECAKRGLLFIGAHNMCLAHDSQAVHKALQIYGEVWQLMKDTDSLEAALEGPPTIVPYRMQ